MEGGIKADVLVDGKPGAWLLQYPPQRYWNTVTDQLDCLDLDLWWFVGRVQLDTILVAEVSASAILVLTKIGFCMGTDMGNDMLSSVLPLLCANFLSNQHNISHFEREPYGAPLMFSLMTRWDLDRDFWPSMKYTSRLISGRAVRSLLL